MRMLSGRMHWLTMGVALLVNAQGFTTNAVLGQALLKPATAAAQNLGSAPQAGMPSYGAPYGMHAGPQGLPPGVPGMMPNMMPGGGVMPAGGIPDAPMSMSFPGPAPGEVVYAGAFGGSCDSGCDCGSCGSGCCGTGDCGCGGAGNCICGPACGCGAGGGGSGTIFGPGGSGFLGGGGLLGGGMGGCSNCRGAGCLACGAANGCLLPCRILQMLGPLAPYSEGNAGTQRWFDFYVGTIAFRRTGQVGSFATSNGAGLPTRTNQISTQGRADQGGVPILFSNSISMDRMRYGAEIIANLQTGVGTNLEARYFGLNNWSELFRVNSSMFPNPPPDLFSVFSLYGTNPTNGFDDTDRSFIHTLSYNSELHNGEVNFRKRWVSPVSCVQWSLLGGIRYFDLDENFNFQAIGAQNNTFTASQLRFFDFNTITRNQLTGVQSGGDIWANICPGIQLGIEGKFGIFGNHAEVEALTVSNSIPGAREHIQDGRTAFLSEMVASMVYRLSYSCAAKCSYNLMYVENVALAAENMNARGFSNNLPSGFTANRFPFIDVDGEVFYQGFSAGVEYMW